MKIFSNTFHTLEQGLNYSSLKQKAFSQNIANVDTPNYKAKDVSFKNVFQQTVQQSLLALAILDRVGCVRTQSCLVDKVLTLFFY